SGQVLTARDPGALCAAKIPSRVDTNNSSEIGMLLANVVRLRSPCNRALGLQSPPWRTTRMGRSFFGTRLGRPAVRQLVLGLCVLASIGAAPSFADFIPLGDATDYAVLYEGTGGHNLSITNVTINGNIGVGGTGVVQFSGPGTITGRLDFSAANSGQFHNTNGQNVGPSSVNYNVAAVMSALSTVNSLNSSLGGLTGVNLAISGTQTINESAGNLQTFNGVTYRVFNVTSYSVGDGKVVTINGD